MDIKDLEKAFQLLDQRLEKPLKLVMGGGAAMLAVYGHPAATADVNAVPVPYQPLSELEPLLFEVSDKLNIPKDWLNTHFTDFTYVLPEDFHTRLRPYYSGTFLKVEAFGPEDMIILKCMAGRNKDKTHLRLLLRLPEVNFQMIEDHLIKLKNDGLGKAQNALTLFEELRNELVT